MQGVLGNTACSCFHCCLGWVDFSHNHKIPSAVSPPPNDLLFPSPLTLETPPEKEGRDHRATKPDEKAHYTLMKQLPSGQTHYHRLMIWFNYLDKIRGRTFGALSERWRIERLKLRFTQQSRQRFMITPRKLSLIHVYVCMRAVCSKTQAHIKGLMRYEPLSAIHRHSLS